MTNEELLDYLDVPFKFWRCPDHPTGLVEWEDNIARCCECDRTNKKNNG